MMLLSSVGGLIESFLFAFLLVSSGALLLRGFGIEVTRAESVLYSLVVGLVALEVFVTLGELAPDVRNGVRAAVGAICLLGLFVSVRLARAIGNLFSRLRECALREKRAASALGAILLVEGLAAMAPLGATRAPGLPPFLDLRCSERSLLLAPLVSQRLRRTYDRCQLGQSARMASLQSKRRRR